MPSANYVARSVHVQIFLLDLEFCPEGLRVTFRPKSQKGPPMVETFLVPKRIESQNTVDFYAIISKYIEVMTKQLAPTPG